ncbi:MAG: hypothetical protein JRG95_20785 [Deltaproteobacteria bacterium]|nr:hypothetical protein [Deltaproteobacteria bacterium]
MNTLQLQFLMLIFAGWVNRNQQGRVVLAARAALGLSGSADVGAILRPIPAKIDHLDAPRTYNQMI